MTFRERLRDWRRGYSDMDIQSAAQKMRAPQPGEWIEVTDGEFRAILDMPIVNTDQGWMRCPMMV